MWLENKGWMGVRADFHFGPSAYVKMLSLSPSRVLPLQMPELSVHGGLRGGWGGEERARGRKSGKISILNKPNFVLQSPDYHSSLFAMLPKLPVPFWLFFFFHSCLLLFSCPPSSLSRTLQDGVSALNCCANLMNCFSQAFEFNVQDA